MIVLMWVLVVYPNYNNVYTVPGIATEKACRELGTQLATQTVKYGQQYVCRSYEGLR
jgi:hypothetical protein